MIGKPDLADLVRSGGDPYIKLTFSDTERGNELRVESLGVEDDELLAVLSEALYALIQHNEGVPA